MHAVRHDMIDEFAANKNQKISTKMPSLLAACLLIRPMLEQMRGVRLQKKEGYFEGNDPRRGPPLAASLHFVQSNMQSGYIEGNLQK